MPEQWSSRYALMRPDGTTPLPTNEVPLFRAFNGELVVDDELVVDSDSERGQRRVLANGSAIFDGDGKKLGAVVAIHDITARVQARDRTGQPEKARRNGSGKHQRRRRRCLRHNRQKLTYVNPALREMAGIGGMGSDSTPDWAVEQLTLYDRTTDRRVKWEERPIARALGGERVDSVEFRLKSSSDSYRNIVVSACPITGADGNITGAVATWHDITELRAGDVKVRAIYESAFQFIGLLDPAGQRRRGQRDGRWVSSTGHWVTCRAGFFGKPRGGITHLRRQGALPGRGDACLDRRDGAPVLHAQDGRR